MCMIARAIVAGLALLLLAPAAAGAATASAKFVYIEGYRGSSYQFYEVTYAAAPGEANHVTALNDGDTVTIHDDGATIAAGDRCTRVSPGEVSCAVDASDSAELSLDLGDAADEATLRSTDYARNSAAGGAGDDRLTTAPDSYASSLDGGDGDDVLTGGDEDDNLTGGGGADSLTAGRGRDTLIGDGEGASPSPDALAGGGGEDTVWYADRTEPVEVDLAAGAGGQAGEGDKIDGVEDIVGGLGGDLLAGNDAPNLIYGEWLEGAPKGGDVILGRGGKDRLEGAQGPDSISGGDGDDDLSGSLGKDAYDGGAGDDTIDADDRHHREIVTCGAGVDTVNYPTAVTVLRHDCERAFMEAGADVSVGRTSQGIRVRALVPKYLTCFPRDLRVVLRHRGRVVGSAELARLRRGRTRASGVLLTAYGQQLLAKDGEIELGVALKTRGPCQYKHGFRRAGRYRVRL
jgi:Ca2+-binding RTX toxin-like protein